MSPVIDHLRGFRILVTEDDYFIAKSVARTLAKTGAVVVGPLSTDMDVHRHIAQCDFNLAVLNVRLRDASFFRTADWLQACGIPFIFMSGYDREFIPERFSAVPRCLKPHHEDELVDLIAARMTDAASNGAT